jgi:menaquinone-dependent protoporphyrinogen oxidase
MSTDRIVVAYATRHGQARRIAEHVARELETWGWPCDLVDVAEEPLGEWPAYAAAILVAPVHAGHHEKAMIRFVKGALPALGRIPNAFLSVTLTEADVEDPKATPERHAKAAADVNTMVEAFVKETGWRPQQVLPVAGAVLFTQYNPILRFVMKQIVKRGGHAADTSRDYEFTDWGALGRFAQQFAHDLRANHVA